MRRFMFSTLLIIIVMLWSTTSGAVEVTATGEGRTRQEAINNGTRAAIEQALGTHIKSNTEVNQGKLVFDRVATAGAGYVRNYEVLAEGRDPLSDSYRVKLRVTIDDYKLQNAVAEFIKDPRAQRTFQETKFDERKIVIRYKPRTGLDLPYDSKAVQSVIDLIEDKLIDKGFRVFQWEGVQNLRKRDAEGVTDREIDLERGKGYDAEVQVSFDAGKRPTSDGYLIIYATLTVKAFDVTTGEAFANVQDRGKTMSRDGNYGLADGIARAAIKVGPRVTDRLVKKIVERFSTKRAKFVSLIFKDVSSDTQFKVEEMLTDIGYRYRVAGQTGTYIEFEIFSESDPTSVRMSVKRQLRKAGLKLKPAQMAGSRITFVGSATAGF